MIGYPAFLPLRKIAGNRCHLISVRDIKNLNHSGILTAKHLYEYSHKQGQGLFCVLEGRGIIKA